jgi:hypothetical protein
MLAAFSLRVSVVTILLCLHSKPVVSDAYQFRINSQLIFYLPVARLVSDILSANRDNEDFEVYVQTCSVTYM